MVATGEGAFMEFEAFRVIAQISAGLTGFVGIILLLQDRLTKLPKRQMTAFLQTSVGALAFALLPDLVFSMPIKASVGWQVLGGSFGLFHLFTFASFLMAYLDLRKMPPVQTVIALLSVPVIGAKLALGLGLLMPLAANIYHLGLLWMMGIAIFFFVQVILNEAADDPE